MRHAITPSFTAGTWKDHESVVMLSLSKANGFWDLVRQTIGWLFSGLNNSKRALPSASEPDWLMTCAAMVTSSPSRRKRGQLGCTIRGFEVMMLRVR